MNNLSILIKAIKSISQQDLDKIVSKARSMGISNAQIHQGLNLINKIKSSQK